MMANVASDKSKKVLAGIMASSHWNTRWKKSSGDKRSYAAIFAEQLKLSWARHKQAEDAKHNAATRQNLRDEQNWGLPLRSYYVRPSRLAAVGE
jgi:hypothetical protein